ncbi:MAG TPA: ATP-binding protein [Acidimicrobiales bacterium]|nr:ATP-binding protein [Acidimicrobiales bacterium]
MFRTTHIRTKLAGALAVPLVALVAVAGFEVVSATNAVDEARTQTDLATASLGPGSLVVSLQDERNRAAIDLIGLGSATELAVDTNEEARGLVDAALADLRNRVAAASPEVQASFAPAFEAITGLQALRADIDAYAGPMDLSNDEFADEVFGRYTDLVEVFFDATSTLGLSLDDADLRNGVELIDAATRQSEMRARIVRSSILAAVTGTVDSPATIADIAALYDRGRGYDADIRQNAVGPFAGVADATFAEPSVQEFNAQVEGFLAGQPLDIKAMLGAVSSDPDSGYLGLRARTGATLTAAAADIHDSALERQNIFVVVAAAGLILAILTTWMASRSITRPLHSLKVQAEHMAGSSLPSAVRQILETPPGEDVVIPEIEPIIVRSHDEVAEVAAALGAVQTSALDLAVEQAVLRRNISDSYINLGRRNQNLLSRQLDFITDLERNESDPDALEGLFRLDHLATRMRRNAESLLVLAGIEAPRQWSAPVKASDVVRAALGEVEDYQRVIVRHLEPAAITGSVASDVAHVIAELLENALSFSPPEQSVEIKGRLTITGYTLAISDNGLGMSAEDIERANRRLAGLESFTVAPSRYLGHYVAGHLASRVGLVVELQDSPAGGVTARIDIPMDLLANEETDPFIVSRTAAAEPAPAPPAAREVEATTTPGPRPAAPAPTPSFTESGLPRRGDRPSAPAEVPATPAPTEEPVPATTVSWEATPDPATPVTAGWDETPTPSEEPTPAVTATWEATPEPLAERTAPGGWDDDLPAPPAQPEPTLPTRPEAVRGFGGLAVARPNGTSMFSVAAEHARRTHGDGAAPSIPSAPATTPTGLTRRIPGAQRPDLAFGTASASAPARTESPAAEEATAPEDVYAFLSSFQAGVDRGRADAHTLDPTEDDR